MRAGGQCHIADDGVAADVEAEAVVDGPEPSACGDVCPFGEEGAWSEAAKAVVVGDEGEEGQFLGEFNGAETGVIANGWGVRGWAGGVGFAAIAGGVGWVVKGLLKGMERVRDGRECERGREERGEEEERVDMHLCCGSEDMVRGIHQDRGILYATRDANLVAQT